MTARQRTTGVEHRRSTDPELVFLATSDLVGITRGRSVPFRCEGEVLRSGTGWVPADLAVSALGTITEDSPFDATGDLRLSPDPATGVDLPADERSPGVRMYLADQVGLDGRPWECCPRHALRSALDDLRAATGLDVVASFEHEFILHGVPATPAFSFDRLRAAEPFGSDLVRLLDACGLEPENWLPEYGADQFEITMRPAGGLVAADRAVLLREIVRDLARRRGLSATFAPMVDPAQSGNGVHVHLSLRDGDGRPALFDADRAGRLSEVGARFCAGVLRHAGAVTGWTAPSPISFDRLRPHRWSAAGAYLGERDREALLRICPTVDGADHAAQFNLEYRAADATANPWLTLAVLVRAGLHGLRADYEPARVWTTAPDPSEVPALPPDTGSALDALEADEVARTWFPDDLRATHLSVRRADVRLLGDQDTADRYRALSGVY